MKKTQNVYVLLCFVSQSYQFNKRQMAFFQMPFFDAKKEKMPSSEQGICIVILLDLLVLYLA